MSARYILGDTRAVTATIPDDSIDLVLCSPPFLALRSYLPADHPLKDLEIGSEPDPATFLDVLLSLTAEWGRVLAPHGSICVELGDTYSGSGGGGGDYLPGGMREGQQQFAGSAASMRESNAAHWRQKATARDGWPLAKSLCGIPHLYHLSLAYGRNLLTGEPSPAGRWRIRNVVAWCRPNPPVGALGDKFRPATSYLTIATRSPRRYFDLDAVRTPPKPGQRTDWTYRQGDAIASTAPGNAPRKRGGTIADNPAGAPPLDYWVIPTQPYSGSHYAAYPPALCERPIDAMVPQRVCTICGEPSRRIIKTEQVNTGRTTNGPKSIEKNRVESPGYTSRTVSKHTTTGWTDCGCPGGADRWRAGVILDPFAGSGTTLMVATGHGRDAIGIDIDPRNAALALDRVGPLLLTVEQHTPEAAA